MQKTKAEKRLALQNSLAKQGNLTDENVAPERVTNQDTIESVSSSRLLQSMFAFMRDLESKLEKRF